VLGVVGQDFLHIGADGDLGADPAWPGLWRRRCERLGTDTKLRQRLPGRGSKCPPYQLLTSE